MGANNDPGDEVHADNEKGYNGLAAPVPIEKIDHRTGPAVILGALRQNGHVISADSKGVLVVETAIPENGNIQEHLEL
jgi:hypothetical protein